MPEGTYGFIGLGNMGFGMAKNLRQSMPKSSTLVVCELNTERRDEFISSVSGSIEAVDSPRAVAEKCVRRSGPTCWLLTESADSNGLLGHHHHKFA
jgi:6-phosphogluconate dehydrogenase (decarboxylating)